MELATKLGVLDAGIPNVQLYTSGKPTTLLAGTQGSAEKLKQQILAKVKKLNQNENGVFVKAGKGNPGEGSTQDQVKTSAPEPVETSDEPKPPPAGSKPRETMDERKARMAKQMEGEDAVVDPEAAKVLRAQAEKQNQQEQDEQAAADPVAAAKELESRIRSEAGIHQAAAAGEAAKKRLDDETAEAVAAVAAAAAERTKKRAEAAPTDPKLDKKVEGYLKRYEFSKLNSGCKKGKIPANQRVWGVPLLNALGQFFSFSESEHSMKAATLVECLVKAGLETDAESFLNAEAAPKRMKQYLLAHHQVPILIPAIEAANPTSYKVVEALIEHGADITAVSTFANGTSTGVTALHTAVIMADPSLMAQSIFVDDGPKNIAQTGKMLAEEVSFWSWGYSKRIERATQNFTIQAEEHGGKIRGKRVSWWQNDISTLMNADAGRKLSILLKSPQAKSLKGNMLRDLHGRTPLHLAAKSGNDWAVRLLLKSIPSLYYVKDNMRPVGYSAETLALYYDRPKVMSSLKGCQKKIMLQQGQTIRQDNAVCQEQDANTGETVTIKCKGNAAPAIKLMPRTKKKDFDTTEQCTEENKENCGHDNGGWGGGTEQGVFSPCDIDEKKFITGRDFYHKYWLPGRPLILRGYADEWNMRKEFKRENLLEKYGGLFVDTGPVPYDELENGKRERDGTLATFVERIVEGKTKTDEAGNPYHMYQDLQYVSSSVLHVPRPPIREQ
jgi:hypothetical protein